MVGVKMMFAESTALRNRESTLRFALSREALSTQMLAIQTNSSNAASTE